MGQKAIPWREVEPLGETNGDLCAVLDSVDALRAAWEDALAHVSRDDFAEARRRSLRRHAIETGVIERLYDLDWGVTEALVAEGITADVAAREGGIEEDTLGLIQSQFAALEFLAEAAREDDSLTISFIRQLHSAITRYQRTYEGRNHLGHIVQAELHHGEWKMWPNHVSRQDGTILEYTPPEQVQSQIERLIELYNESSDAHPIIRAAWLHHRFICIHPFEDGNGRVARALTLLLLLQSKYAPLVVDRRDREQYIASLDAANDGDLRPLVRLFARLEIVALRAELERPAKPVVATGGAVNVARAYAERLRDLRAADTAEKIERANALAQDMHQRLVPTVENLAAGIEEAFQEFDANARSTVYSAVPPEERSLYWKRQLVAAARQVDFYANLTNGSWWVRLHTTVLGQTLRYIAAVQKVGHGETGVLAITAYAEIVVLGQSDEADPHAPEPLLELKPTDSVTLVYTDTATSRWEEVEQFIEDTLAAAVGRFAQRLG
jgi:fido (protein-threonine AMPylation protein)